MMIKVEDHHYTKHLSQFLFPFWSHELLLLWLLAPPLALAWQVPPSWLCPSQSLVLHLPPRPHIPKNNPPHPHLHTPTSN